MASQPNNNGMSAAQQAVVNNANARSLVLRTSVDMWTQIYSNAVVPANQNVLNIPTNNVGLIKGFLIKVAGSIANTAGSGTLALTAFGASNVLSQIIFTDLTNTVRVQTAGWHMGLINSAKAPLVFGGAYAPNVPVNYGNNWVVQTAPSTIAFGTNQVVQFYYYLPLAYSQQDLTGAMFGAVVNAQAQIQITINPTPVMAAGTDATLAVYQGTGAGVGGWLAASTVTVTIWQNYLDQLPQSSQASGQFGNYVLPQLDLSNIYEIKNVAMAGLVQGQDFGIPYANFRTFLSTTVVYDNAGVLNVGGDINYFSLQASNTTQLFKYGPREAALFARSIFLADPPQGTYFFSHRNAPISTQNYGNMQLTVNPSAVTAGAGLLVGFEDFANLSQVSFATSLPTAA